MTDQEGDRRRKQTVKSIKPPWVRQLTFTPSDFLFSKVLHAERKRKHAVEKSQPAGRRRWYNKDESGLVTPPQEITLICSCITDK